MQVIAVVIYLLVDCFLFSQIDCRTEQKFFRIAAMILTAKKVRTLVIFCENNSLAIFLFFLLE